MKVLGTAAVLGALAVVVPVHAHGAGQADARADFFARLTAICGATFEGASVFPSEAGDAFAGKKLMAKIASCTAGEVRVPFLVGADRSRTWIFTKSPAGLELKHDHRHDDGTPDEQTMYGGMANDKGSASAQSFEADAYTAKLIPAASTNVWTVTLAPDGKSMSYHLARDGKPRFKAELARTAN